MTMEVISTRIKADGLRDYLEFDNTGKYQFLTCENCDGPVLGHVTSKCRHILEGEGYDERTVVKFENWLKRIPELRKKIDERAVLEVDRQAQTQADLISRAMRDAAAASEPRSAQIVKPRWPPGWSGQKFDKWKIEVEKWDMNNKSTDEDKFIDLIESLKKNDAIKDFVAQSLLEK